VEIYTWKQFIGILHVHCSAIHDETERVQPHYYKHYTMKIVYLITTYSNSYNLTRQFVKVYFIVFKH